MCWISTAGVLRLETDEHRRLLPAFGPQDRPPNVIFVERCTTAARTANATPNATLGTRYDFTTTGAGTLVFDKVTMSWYPSFSKPATFTMSHVWRSLTVWTLRSLEPRSRSGRSGTGITAGAAARSPLVVTGLLPAGAFLTAHGRMSAVKRSLGEVSRTLPG